MNYPTYICTMWVPICLIKLDDTKWRKKVLLFCLNSRLRQSYKLYYLFARYYNNIISLTRCLKVKITFSIYCFFFSFFRKTRLADYRFSIRYEIRCLLVTKGWHEHSQRKVTPVYSVYLLVTESEIRHGVLGESHPEEQCLWISRNIQDLKNHLQNENVQYFIDINADTKEIDTDAQQLLQVL